MSRIRSIKPEWLDDELLALASPEARTLSIALILLADDYGNGRANPAVLAGRVFPGKVPEVLAKALGELASLRYLSLYEVDGQRYFTIRNWEKHQRVDRPGTPKVPGPSEATPRTETTSTVPENFPGIPANVPAVPGIPAASRASSPIPIPDLPKLPETDQDLPDRLDHPSGVAETKPAKAKRATTAEKPWRRVPADWRPNEGHCEIANELGLDFALELATFRDHRFKDAKVDADATFRNWLRGSRRARASPSRPLNRAEQITADLFAEAQKLEAQESRQ